MHKSKVQFSYNIRADRIAITNPPIKQQIFINPNEPTEFHEYAKPPSFRNNASEDFSNDEEYKQLIPKLDEQLRLMEEREHA